MTDIASREMWHLPHWSDTWDGPSTACGLLGNGGISVLNKDAVITDTDGLCPRCVQTEREKAALAVRAIGLLDRWRADWVTEAEYDAEFKAVRAETRALIREYDALNTPTTEVQ